MDLKLRLKSLNVIYPCRINIYKHTSRCGKSMVSHVKWLTFQVGFPHRTVSWKRMTSTIRSARVIIWAKARWKPCQLAMVQWCNGLRHSIIIIQVEIRSHSRWLIDWLVIKPSRTHHGIINSPPDAPATTCVDHSTHQQLQNSGISNKSAGSFNQLNVMPIHQLQYLIFLAFRHPNY